MYEIFDINIKRVTLIREHLSVRSSHTTERVVEGFKDKED